MSFSFVGLSNRDGSAANLTNGDTSPYLNPQRAKKRKLSQDGSNVHVKQEPGTSNGLIANSVDSRDIITRMLYLNCKELSPDAASSHASALTAVPSIAPPTEDDYGYQDSNSNGPGSVNNDSGVYLDSSFQCIRFQPFQQSSWHALCDQNLKEL